MLRNEKISEKVTNIIPCFSRGNYLVSGVAFYRLRLENNSRKNIPDENLTKYV